jgi:DNA-binding transcriptional MerR regulator
VNIQTLHYYERRGLLSPVRTGSSGYRAYGDAEVTLVRGIKRAQALGFSLGEIEELLAIGSRDRERAKKLASAKLVELDEKIRDLSTIRAALGDLVESCLCGGDLSSCKLFEDLGSDEATRQA